ncbi:hypothetical protein RQC66_36180 [Streptomyces justiciae]|uniref:Uncharacterized protein n=1 Tax=Streptomyces justiciae TaxID=2780140 RepID=A0ABU3M617_9ACTN|nr:hypothetical protein [Streptomyces justiciae]MDT7846168.1 hypothetical protein [Streptomyces justiciae]
MPDGIAHELGEHECGGVGDVDANTLFEAIQAFCRATGLPLPARQMRNDAARIPLVHNEAYGELTWPA